MDTNYRSGTEVIKYAGNLIRINKNRFEKNFHGFREEQGAVSAIACNGPNEEVDSILKDMNSLRKQGVKYTDMAVLYRTNMENQLLAGKLLKLKVPFYTTEAIKLHISRHYGILPSLMWKRKKRGSAENLEQTVKILKSGTV